MEYRIRKQYGDVKEYTYEYANSLKNAIYAEERRVKKGGVPSPTLDSVFKWMFGREETKIFVCLLLSIVIEVEAEELEREMVLIQSEIPPEFFKGRTVRMDFVGKVGEMIFNIEMNRTDTLERNMMYAGKLYELECRRGKEKYDNVIQMNINNFIPYRVEKTIEVNSMSDAGKRRSKIIIIDVYLPLINEKYRRGSELTEDEKMILCMFIGKEREMKKLGGENKYMKEFIKKIKRFMGDEKALEEYARELDAHEAGMERGREEGVERNQIETATTMLKDGMPLETVQKYTKLPLEKIMNIMSLL